MIRYDTQEAALFREKLLRRVKADVSDCYQCGNCSAGCPAAFTFDHVPNQIMRMLQVGLVDEVLSSSAIQLCVQSSSAQPAVRATSMWPASSRT